MVAELTPVTPVTFLSEVGNEHQSTSRPKRAGVTTRPSYAVPWSSGSRAVAQRRSYLARPDFDSLKELLFCYSGTEVDVSQNRIWNPKGWLSFPHNHQKGTVRSSLAGTRWMYMVQSARCVPEHTAKL